MSVFISNMTTTWNNGATVFSAVKMNVTNTASAAGSLLMDIQVGGVSALSVKKDGNLAIMPGFTAGAGIFSIDVCDTAGYFSGYGAGYGTQALTLLASGGLLCKTNTATLALGAASGGDVTLARDAADTLAQRRGTNVQTFNLYNTFTDASNYERTALTYSANVCYQKTEAAGTGTRRQLIPVLNAVTVASLPSAATAGVGARSTVTDGLAPTFMATVAGGGALVTPVYSDGTNWKVG